MQTNTPAARATAVRTHRRSGRNAGFAGVTGQHGIGVDQAKPVGAAECGRHRSRHRVGFVARPVALQFTAAITAESSQLFMLVRSSIFAPGNAATISSNMGPENDFAATVVSMVETLKPFAALARSATLLRNTTASIDFVANAICD